MRQLEGFQSFLDNYGDPLVGRLRFFDKTTSAAANVYDSEGTSLGSIVMTESAGRLAKQVFLADNTDYLVLVDKFVGNGAMVIDDEDLSPSEAYEAREELESNFLNIGAFINNYDVFDIEVTGALQAIENMAALRALNPATVVNGVICLMGYTTAGDKPAVYYVWNESSTESDNGGTIIQRTGYATGRWLMIVGDTIDSRDFNLSPLNSPAFTSTEHKAAVSGFIAAGSGKKLYFAKAGYYDISNETSISYVRCVNGAYIFGDSTQTQTTLRYCDNTTRIFQRNDYTRHFSFTDSDVLYTSQCQSATVASTRYFSVEFHPTSRMVFDNSNFIYESTLSITGVECVFTGITYIKLALTGCNIISDEMLKADSTYTLAFENCILNEDYFYSGNNLSYCTFNDCALGVWHTFDFAYAVDPMHVDAQSSVTVGSAITLDKSGVFRRVAFGSTVTINDDCNCVFDSCSFAGMIGRRSSEATGGTAVFQRCAFTGTSDVDWYLSEAAVYYCEFTNGTNGVTLVAPNSFVSNSTLKGVRINNNSTGSKVELDNAVIATLAASNASTEVSVLLKNSTISGSQTSLVINTDGSTTSTVPVTGSCQGLLSGGTGNVYINNAPSTRDSSKIIYTEGLTTRKVLTTAYVSRTFLKLSEIPFSAISSWTTIRDMTYYLSDTVYHGIGSEVVIENDLVDTSSAPGSNGILLWKAPVAGYEEDEYIVGGTVSLAYGQTLTLHHTDSKRRYYSGITASASWTDDAVAAWECDSQAMTYIEKMFD